MTLSVVLPFSLHRERRKEVGEWVGKRESFSEQLKKGMDIIFYVFFVLRGWKRGSGEPN